MSPFEIARKTTDDRNSDAELLDLWTKARWDLERQVSGWKARASMLHQQTAGEIKALMKWLAPDSPVPTSQAEQKALGLYQELENVGHVKWSTDNVSILSGQVSEVAALLDKVPAIFGEAESKAYNLHAVALFASTEYAPNQG